MFARWATSERATGTTGTPLANYGDLAKCFDQVRVAFELAFGRIRLNDPHPDASKINRMFIEHLWSIVRFGSGHIKTWCHARRHLACTAKPLESGKGSRRHPVIKFGRGISPTALLAASGLDRAFTHTPTKREMEEELDSAFDRLTAEKHVQTRQRKHEILDFTYRICRQAKRIGLIEATDGEIRRFVPLPAPQGSACAGAGVRTGGQKQAADAWVKNRDDHRLFKVWHMAALIRLRRDLYRDIDQLEYGHMRLKELSEASRNFPALVRTHRTLWTQGYFDRWCEDEYRRAHDLIEFAEGRIAHLRRLVTETLNAQPSAAMSAGLLAYLKPNRFRWPKSHSTAAAAQAPNVVAQEACRRCVHQLNEGRKSTALLKVFPSVTGKLRLATVHEPHIVLAARAMTRMLIGMLRNVRTNKSMLRNEVIVLRDDAGRVIYSGDWSKATDHIGSDTAIFIATRALECVGAPEWMVAAVPAVCGNMTLETEDGRRAEMTCGALMGLGVSWFVMSILNSYCATRAGGKSSDFAVNGDDLVASWTPAVCDAYEANCESIGIVVNRAKSFRGRLGVFCEQQVAHEVRDGRLKEQIFCLKRLDKIRAVKKTEVVARSYFRLGETSGVKSIEGLKGHLVADTLRWISEGHTPEGFLPTLAPIRKLASRTLQRVALLRHRPGRLSEGGGGLGNASAATLKVFIMGGPTSLRTKRKSARESLETRLRLSEIARAKGPTPGKPVARVRDLAEALTIRDNRAAELDGAWALRARAKEVTKREHQKRLNCRYVTASALTIGGALALDSTRARYSAKARSVAYAHAARGRYSRAIKYLQNHTRLIDAESIPDVSLQPLKLRAVEVRRGLQLGDDDHVT